MSCFASQGILNWYPSIWLDGAKPANTGIPLSFLWNVPVQLCSVPTPKIRLQVFKKCEKLRVISFQYKKEFDLLTFGNSEFVKCQI